MLTRRVKEKLYRNLLAFNGDCFTFTEDLQPGDYTFRFEFALPETLPASIMFKNDNHADRPKVFIKYSVRAKIVTNSGKELKYKQMVMIHEPPIEFKVNYQNTVTIGLNTYGCCDMGTANLAIKFDKNIFY